MPLQLPPALVVVVVVARAVVNGDVVVVAVALHITRVVVAGVVAVMIVALGLGKTCLKSVAKNNAVKRDQFWVHPLRHVMFEQGRASINEKTHALALRDRARQARCTIEPHTCRTTPNILCAKYLFCAPVFPDECALGIRDYAYVLNVAPLIPRRAPSLRQRFENSENASQNN